MRLIGIVVVLAVVTLVAWYVYEQYKLREARWVEAKRNPKWEVSERTYQSGDVYVSLELMARYAGQQHTFATTHIGVAQFKQADWELQLNLLRNQAQCRANVLNEARNKSGES